MRRAERLLETLPGVVSASLEGDLANAAEVRLLIEDNQPPSQTLEAVRSALQADTDERPLGALFRIQVASVGDEARTIRDEPHEEPTGASRDTPKVAASGSSLTR